MTKSTDRPKTAYDCRANFYTDRQRIEALEREVVELRRVTIEKCANIAERVCREHADPKAGYAAATAIRALAHTRPDRNSK